MLGVFNRVWAGLSPGRKGTAASVRYIFAQGRQRAFFTGWWLVAGGWWLDVDSTEAYCRPRVENVRAIAKTIERQAASCLRPELRDPAHRKHPD